MRSATKARKAVAILADPAPRLRAIVAHLREQQCRVYHAAQSVEIAMKAIDTMDEEGTNKELVALWGGAGAHSGYAQRYRERDR
jgi:hypothetical protein